MLLTRPQLLVINYVKFHLTILYQYVFPFQAFNVIVVSNLFVACMFCWISVSFGVLSLWCTLQTSVTTTILLHINQYLQSLFSVFMWHNHIPKLNITFPSQVLVSSDKRPYRNLTFHDVSSRQGSSYCNKACLNYQAFAWCDMKIATREGCRVGQKMSYRF